MLVSLAHVHGEGVSLARGDIWLHQLLELRGGRVTLAMLDHGHVHLRQHPASDPSGAGCFRGR